MHVGKLMARLNAKNARFDVGSGGVSELTSTDIAGALAFVPAGLGRELLCHVWWPDGAALSRSQLDGQLLQLQLAEHNLREQAMYSALAGIACGPVGDSRHRANSAYGAAHAKRWPEWVIRLEPLTIASRYALIRSSILEELGHPRDCPACHARGFLSQDGLIVECVRCDGLGRIKFGPTWRSRRLGVKEATYRNTWASPYDWLYDKAYDSLLQAERSMRAATT